MHRGLFFRVLLIFWAAVGTSVAQSPPVGDEVDPTQPAVKKSNSGICHEKGSQYYEQTKQFEVFDSLEACLKSGGRLPKKAGASKEKAIVKKALSSGICHDASSPNYDTIERYERYATMEECVKSGGKPRAR